MNTEKKSKKVKEVKDPVITTQTGILWGRDGYGNHGTYTDIYADGVFVKRIENRTGGFY